MISRLNYAEVAPAIEVPKVPSSRAYPLSNGCIPNCMRYRGGGVELTSAVVGGASRMIGRVSRIAPVRWTALQALRSTPWSHTSARITGCK